MGIYLIKALLPDGTVKQYRVQADSIYSATMSAESRLNAVVLECESEESK